MIEVVNTEPWHVVELAETMRAEDINEIRASHNHSPMEALISSVEQSTMTKCILIDGKVIGVMGVTPVNIIGSVGCPWWLSSTYLDDYKLSFLKLLRENSAELFGIKSSYNTLVNFVDARYKKSVKWLKWLGFDVSDCLYRYGHAGIGFHMVGLEVNHG